MPVKFTIEEVDGDAFAPELAALEALVFHSEPLGIAAFGPKSKSEEALKIRVSTITKAPEGSSNRFTKAVDENGKTIGASFWNIRDEPWVVKESDGVINRERYPPGANFEVIEAAFGRALRNRVESMGGKRYATLNILVVLPEYQRQGIGSALLTEGLVKLDGEALSAWLGASEYGLGLYLKHGFVVEETWTVDLRPYGFDVVVPQACMSRGSRTN